MRLRFVYVAALVFYSITSFMCDGSPTEINIYNIASTDTTSQNFRFESFQFGDGQETGILNDVWVFDKNNIWAVGYISQDIEPAANILHWNGVKWERIGSLFNDTGLESICALDTSHIYFAAGSMAKYTYGRFELINPNLTFEQGQAINILWGNSEMNIWGAGPNGTIVHFNGNSWKKIDFDRKWFFYRITGSASSGTAFALARNSEEQTIIVKLQVGKPAEVIYNTSASPSLPNAWTMSLVNENEIYAAGRRIWKLNTETKETEILYKSTDETNFEQSYSYAYNDVYFLGNDNSGSVLIHFNGIRFSKFQMPESFDINGNMFAVRSLAVSVGSADNKASIIEIIRN